MVTSLSLFQLFDDVNKTIKNAKVKCKTQVTTSHYGPEINRNFAKIVPRTNQGVRVINMTFPQTNLSDLSLPAQAEVTPEGPQIEVIRNRLGHK